MDTKHPRSAKSVNPLLLAWQQGNMRAGSRLLERHSDELEGFFYRKVGDPQTAEDLRQETFLQAHRSLPKFRSESTFRTWLYGIARNVLRTHIRRRSTRGRDAWCCPLEEVCGPLIAPEDIELAEEDFIRALRTLTADEQILIDLIYLRGMSYAKAATAIAHEGLLVTLRARVYEAKQALIRALGELEAEVRASEPSPTTTTAMASLRLRLSRLERALSNALAAHRLPRGRQACSSR